MSNVASTKQSCLFQQNTRKVYLGKPFNSQSLFPVEQLVDFLIAFKAYKCFLGLFLLANQLLHFGPIVRYY
jgi:hypothetical protein